MRKWIVVMVLFLTACAVAPANSPAISPAAAEGQRWVVSEGSVLMAEASVSAAQVAELAVGAEVAVLEDQGRWLKVRANSGQTGWIYAGRVSTTPPVAEVSGGEGGLFGATMQESQIHTAKADSARSIRGLSPEVTQYAQQRGTPEAYRKALDTILARSVSPKELKAFLREGKLGEYAQ